MDRSHTVAVLSVALAMRLLVLWTVLTHYPPQWLFTRGIEMGLLAKSVLAGQGLSSPFGGSTGPTAFIAPAYPLLIALVFKVFGPFTTAAAIVVMSAQIALNLGTIWFIMRLARSMFSQTAATFAGLIWACSLPLIWMPTIFWDTSLSCFLLTGMFALALRYRECVHVAPLEWVGFGVYCGLASLTNPALLPSLILIALWIVFQTHPGAGSRPILSALAFVLVFSPWPLRNAMVFHAFIPLRTTVGFELWMGNHEHADGFLDESLFPMYNHGELADYKARGEVAYTAHKSELARDYIYAHPSVFSRMTLVRAKRFWAGTGSRNGSKLFAAHAIFTTVFGLAGLWLLVRSKRYACVLLFALPMAVFPLPYLITHAEFRYRLVLDPLLTLFSGYALTELFKHIRRSSAAPARTASAVYEASLTHAGRTI